MHNTKVKSTYQLKEIIDHHQIEACPRAMYQCVFFGNQKMFFVLWTIQMK
jgi:hypothetical protein